MPRSSSTRALYAVVCIAVLSAVVLSAGLPSAGSPPARPEKGGVPPEYQKGEARFNALCARCHGAQGKGTGQGPPLVDKIYEPSHHGDGAFFMAALNGVRAHHWKFGDMPKVEGATKEDVEQIVKYVRWLQRQAGIM